MILYIDIGWALSTNWKWDGDLSEGGSKLYIPSNLNISKRCSPKPFGQTKNMQISLYIKNWNIKQNRNLDFNPKFF